MKTLKKYDVEVLRGMVEVYRVEAHSKAEAKEYALAGKGPSRELEVDSLALGAEEVKA